MSVHPSSPSVVGVLMAGDRAYPAFGALSEVLRESGRTTEIAARFAEGDHDRLPELARALLSVRPDVFLAIGAVSFYAIRRAAPEAPVVFAVVVDPGPAGIVRETRPAALVTGATSFDPDQPRRQIRLLRQAIPGLTDLAILGDADVPPLLADLTRAAVIAEGLRPVLHLLRGPEEIVPAVTAFRNGGAHGLVVLEVPRTSTYGEQIVEAANDAGLPTLFGRDMARACPLIACGTSFAFAARRAAGQVNRILSGTDISVLPIEHVVKFEVVINLDTARKLGQELPVSVLRAATQTVDTAVSR